MPISDVLSGVAGVLLSLALCLMLIWVQQGRSADSRGFAGLAVSGLHLILSLALPALIWMVRKPVSPLAFVLSVLVFYWVSLIILVLTIIRWIRGAGTPLEVKESRQK